MDGSGSVTNANEIVVDNNYVYPYGTTEQFPQMQDSDLQTLSDTAHYYMECSNKGRCDRTTGECACFEGYDGVACQRASCPGYPNSCSGHGVCKTIRQLASADYGNVYELWDKDTTMGCECDAGYFGADCSQRSCKHGVDPLYLDDAATVHFSTYDVGIITTSAAHNFSNNIYEHVKHGKWALRFYDNFGEDWVTSPIDSSADCEQVVSALEALPNNVIPSGTIQCTETSFYKQNGSEVTFSTRSKFYDAQHPSTSSHPYRIFYKMALWEAQTAAIYDELSPATDTTAYFSSYQNLTTTVALSGIIYRLKFYGNPGKLRQPQVETYLDGSLPTLLVQDKKVITKVWTDGQQGEDNDYFADHCAGVTVTIGTTYQHGFNFNNQDATHQVPDYHSYLTGLTVTEKNLLKACLGGSDFNSSNNVDVYNWDHGNKLYPHLIKLVRTVTTLTDGGYYAALWYDTAGFIQDNLRDGTAFRLLNPFVPPDAFLTDNYDVYTTHGTLALTSELSEATFGFGSQYIYTTNVTYDTNNTIIEGDARLPYDGDISCEVGANNAEKFNYIYHCLNKSDVFTLLNWEYPQWNPPHINLYTAERVYKKPYTHSTYDRWANYQSSPALQNFPGYIANNTLDYMTYQITADISTNWGVSVSSSRYLNRLNSAKFHVYKFFPAPESTYNYVNECANRGICDRDHGVCKCFPGYTSDNCAEQSSLAL